MYMYLVLCHIAKYIIEVCNMFAILFRIRNAISTFYWDFVSKSCSFGRLVFELRKSFCLQSLQATEDKLKSHHCNELEKNSKVIQPHLEMNASLIMTKKNS